MNVEQYNQNPQNQLCREKLLQAQQKPDPYFLYSLQLLIWGLENIRPLNGPWEKYHIELLQQAEEMLGWQPENVQQLFPQDEEQNLNSKLSPQNFTLDLIEIFWDKLRTRRPEFSDGER